MMHSFGTGPASVTALHCSLAHGGVWSGVAAGLSRKATLRAPDLLGHGSAPDWDGTGSFGQAALDLVLGDIPAEGPVHLIGHSFGAVLALMVARDLGPRLATLTLIEPVWFGLARGAPGFVQDQVQTAKIWAAHDAGRVEEAAKAFTDLWGTGLPWTAMGQRHRDDTMARLPLIRAQSDLIHGDLGLPDLTVLRAPTLLIEGAKSPPVVAEIQVRLAAKLPYARRVIVPDAGHMVPITHAEAVAPEIAMHLSGL